MKAVGIILAGGSSTKMKELTKVRAAAAMPMAGSYRAIDFALSNMSNSGVSKVAVLTQYNSRAGCMSLHRPSPQRIISGLEARQMRYTRTWIF